MKYKYRFIFAAGLMIISNLGWVLPITVIPLLDISLEQMGLYTLICIIFGQVTYNVGLFMIGAQLLKRLKLKGIHFKDVRMQTLLLIKNIKKKIKARVAHSHIARCL